MKSNKKIIEIGSKIFNWEVISSLDSGGSGDVFLIKNVQNANEYILKKLRQKGKGREERFDSEIEILYQLKDNPGIIQIVSDYQKNESEFKEKWYIVEKGMSFKNLIEDRKKQCDYPSHYFLKWLFEKYIELLMTLNDLNKNKIYHRDIKPENIVYINDRFVFIDFGIARTDENITKNLTEQYDKYNLGAKFYMAPEMRRDPLNADNSKVDIYSITKTIWATLTGEYLSFDGQYNEKHDWFDKVIQIFPKIKNELIQISLEKETINSISNMFYKNTSDLPEERMSIGQTIDILKNWLSIFYKDSNTTTLSFSQKDTDRRWNFAIGKFFQGNIPKNYTWEASTINTILFNTFEDDYFNVYLPNESMNRFKIKIEGNDLILENTFINKKTKFEIDYNWLFYREEEDFSYFYSKMKIKSKNDFIIITNDHIKGQYAHYYNNRRCEGFGNSFDIINEESYFNECRDYILKFKKHLIGGCSYCLSEFEKKNIDFNPRSNIFKDMI